MFPCGAVNNISAPGGAEDQAVTTSPLLDPELNSRPRRLSFGRHTSATKIQLLRRHDAAQLQHLMERGVMIPEAQRIASRCLLSDFHALPDDTTEGSIRLFRSDLGEHFGRVAPT
jgi:hypothetical protein